MPHPEVDLTPDMLREIMRDYVYLIFTVATVGLVWGAIDHHEWVPWMTAQVVVWVLATVGMAYLWCRGREPSKTAAEAVSDADETQ